MSLPPPEIIGLLVVQPTFGLTVVQAPDAADSSFVTSGEAVSTFVFSLNGGRDGENGATGAPGEDATVHARRYEESGNYIYCATAPSGSAESSAVWRITRVTYSSGTLVSSGVATNVTWTGRAGHTYI